MLISQTYLDIVSGHRGGIVAGAVRKLLQLAAYPYRLAVDYRNHRYDRGEAEIHEVRVPIICAGNLTLGGTGKSPMVAWLAAWFLERGVRPAVVSRGYRKQQSGENDEAAELAQKLPHVPHEQDRDRVAAARRAAALHAAHVILLDDGFQHRRLARDLDIVLVDALQPTGYGHLFPRGTLREPLSGLRRAHLIVLTRADLIQPQERVAIRDELLCYAPLADWCEVAHRPLALRRLDTPGVDGIQQPLDALQGKSLAAFCGIGNPEAFRRTLERCGYQLADFRAFADHHAFTNADREALQAWAEKSGAEALVCTEKDAVKLAGYGPSKVPLWSLAVEIEFLSGKQRCEQRLAALLARAGLGSGLSDAPAGGDRSAA